jgi:hypothetical protein
MPQSNDPTPDVRDAQQWQEEDAENPYDHDSGPNGCPGDCLACQWEDEHAPEIRCKFCNVLITAPLCHTHQGSCVCEDCWDERLRPTA